MFITQSPFHALLTWLTSEKKVAHLASESSDLLALAGAALSDLLNTHRSTTKTRKKIYCEKTISNYIKNRTCLTFILDKTQITLWASCTHRQHHSHPHHHHRHHHYHHHHTWWVDDSKRVRLSWGTPGGRVGGVGRTWDWTTWWSAMRLWYCIWWCEMGVLLIVNCSSQHCNRWTAAH